MLPSTYPVAQIPLQNFRQVLPQFLPPIELYIAAYAQVLELFGQDYLQLLPENELQRAQTFYRKADRQRFLAARLLLRCRLSQQSQQGCDLGQLAQALEPRFWQLGSNRYGKPFLCDSESVQPSGEGKTSRRQLPFFNLAHSGDYLALALSSDIELGLDIEGQRKQRSNILGIAQMLFSQTEQQKLQQMLQHDQEAAQQLFFQLWCHYEALGKLEGTGLLAKPQEAVAYSYYQGQFCCTDTQIDYFWALCWRTES